MREEESDEEEYRYKWRGKEVENIKIRVGY